MLAEDKVESLHKGLLSDETPQEVISISETASSQPEGEVEAAPLLRTDRCKAVIFVNIYSVVLFSYLACTKHATTEKGINTLDLCLVRGFVLLIGAFVISKFAGTSLYVEKQDRCKVLAFALTGTFGMVFLLFGVTMVPLLVQSTLLNTAPFWASLLGCIFLMETLARIEIVALFLSFVGVLLVTLSTKSDENESQVPGSEEQEGLSSKFVFLIGCLFVIIASWVEAIITLIARRM